MAVPSAETDRYVSTASTSATTAATTTVSGKNPAINVPIVVMTFILGAFIALALKTQNIVRSENLPSSRYSGLAEAYMGMKKEIPEYQATIQGLQHTNEQLDQAVSARAPRMKVLMDQVDQDRAFAGLTDVKGPGIIVTLSDSKQAPKETEQTVMSSMIMSNYVIHDVDIQRVLNELKAGGAEAFSVSGQRVIATTAIRCVGPAIQVNGVPLTSPYKLEVIGDPDTLAKSLTIAGGIADAFKVTDPAMISIQKSKALLIPAYAGAMDYKYAHPVYEESSASQAGA
jgi:uncharacterized protein YlxW (UPF0749 family)